MAKKVTISGYYGFENFGDEGILGILVQNLKDSGLCDEITVFSHNPDITSKKYCVNSINTFAFGKVLNNLENTDVLISGGGSLLQDTTSLKSLLYYLWVIFMSLYYKKKVVIFAQGIGPIKCFVSRLVTKILLKKCDYISVRDEKSLFLLRGWGLKPELVADPMWNLELKPNFPSNRVGIQLRKWKTLPDNFLSKLAEKVAETYKHKEIYIYSFQDSQDLEICKKFELFLNLKDSDIKTHVVNNHSNEEIIESFKYLDRLIAMRYHACLLGLKYGIKTLPISYDEKVEKLAKELEIPYVELTKKCKIEELIDEMEALNMYEVNEKVKSMKFDFEPIFKVIED